MFRGCLQRHGSTKVVAFVIPKRNESSVQCEDVCRGSMAEIDTCCWFRDYWMLEFKNCTTDELSNCVNLSRLSLTQSLVILAGVHLSVLDCISLLVGCCLRFCLVVELKELMN